MKRTSLRLRLFVRRHRKAGHTLIFDPEGKYLRVSCSCGARGGKKRIK